MDENIGAKLVASMCDEGKLSLESNMNKLVSILGGLAIAFSVSSAQAIETYWDIDFFAPSDGWLKKGDVLKDVFNIVDEGGPLDVGGFDPDTEEVFEAWVYLGLYDDKFRDRREPKEVVRIKLGGDRLAKGPVPWRFGFLFDDWEIEGDFLVDLNADGKLRYSIKSRKGDFGVF